MSFTTLAYAKLNLSFNQELFVKEYDQHIYPRSFPIVNGISSVNRTIKLNKKFKMIDPEIYEQVNTFNIDDKGNRTFNDKGRKSWEMCQLMEMETVGETNPTFLKFADIGGVGLRNAAFDRSFKIKKVFENLEIVKWIYSNLPFEKIISIHCVAIDPGGFSTFHRDDKSLADNKSSIGINNFYRNNFIIININVSNGGVPLYWCLDDFKECRTEDHLVYLTNDYFLHGVPEVTSRRRQIRVSGIPKPEMQDLFVKDSIIDIGSNYQYHPGYPG
jgi:hypothetical protein